MPFLALQRLKFHSGAQQGAPKVAALLCCVVLMINAKTRQVHRQELYLSPIFALLILISLQLHLELLPHHIVCRHVEGLLLSLAHP